MRLFVVAGSPPDSSSTPSGPSNLAPQPRPGIARARAIGINHNFTHCFALPYLQTVIGRRFNMFKPQAAQIIDRIFEYYQRILRFFQPIVQPRHQNRIAAPLARSGRASISFGCKGRTD